MFSAEVQISRPGEVIILSGGTALALDVTT